MEGLIFGILRYKHYLSAVWEFGFRAKIPVDPHFIFFSKLNTEPWADRKLLTALFQGRRLSDSSL